jgi:mannosyltransferase
VTLVVHPHFHRRRTGVTGHVEAMVRTQGNFVETRAIGTGLSASVPGISWGELLRRARREQVVWHAHRNNELLAGLLLRLVARRVRLVFTRHASHPPSAYTRWLFRRADQAIALTEEIARTLALPAAVISHGIDFERFSPPADRERAFRELGLGGSHGIGVIGRIRPAKGQGDLVEAIAPLLPSHPGWQVALVGQARPADRAWAEGFRSRLGDRLSMPGEQADVARWYRGLSVLVHPSHSEGFSLVLIEAMAAGCCVVASALPHVPAVVEHGRTGFLYPPGDVVALRELLAMLMADPARAARVGRAAAEEARFRFGLEREAAALLDAYRIELPGRLGPGAGVSS